MNILKKIVLVVCFSLLAINVFIVTNNFMQLLSGKITLKTFLALALGPSFLVIIAFGLLVLFGIRRNE